MLQGKCKKCGCIIQILQKGFSRKQVIEKIKRWETFECPGHHVELSSPYPNYWCLDEFEELPDPQVSTEQEWLKQMREKYKEVLDAEEFYRRGVLKEFCFGFPVTTDRINWDFTQSPSGKRYYFHS